MNSKQKRFCEEFVVDLNMTQAAIRAEYSAKTAGSIGARLLKNVEIQSYISELKQKRNEILQISQQSVLRKLVEFCETDVTQILTIGLEDLEEIPIELRKMVVSVKQKRTHFKGGHTDEIELKFMDKTKLIDMINRHIGFYEIDNTQKQTNIIVVPPKKD